MDCIFCKIVDGSIPSKTLYEDDLVKAFYDIQPAAPVHFLVVPKQHIPSVNGVDSGNSAVVAHIFEVIPKLAAQLKLDAGYRVVSNCGEDAGQTVPHLHFHVLAGKKLNLSMA